MNTLDYYNSKTDEFISSTVDVDFSGVTSFSTDIKQELLKKL